MDNNRNTRPCDCCGEPNMPHAAGLEMCDECADDTNDAYLQTDAERDELDHERDVLAEAGR